MVPGRIPTRLLEPFQQFGVKFPGGLQRQWRDFSPKCQHLILQSVQHDSLFVGQSPLDLPIDQKSAPAVFCSSPLFAGTGSLSAALICFERRCEFLERGLKTILSLREPTCHRLSIDLQQFCNRDRTTSLDGASVYGD
jgi:hypothetical protein